VVSDSTLPAATQELVKLRASQINGCGFCSDMHTKDAAQAGETSTRLNLVAAWREATVFSDAERAALELAEQGTRIADAAGGVTDEAWANAPSTTTRTSSPPWCPRSPSSTPSTGRTSSSSGPRATTSPASSDDKEQRCNSKRGGDTDMKEPVAEIAREIHGHRSRHHDRH
jgi:AhpD family alkylhydroperoxidase